MSIVSPSPNEPSDSVVSTPVTVGETLSSLVVNTIVPAAPTATPLFASPSETPRM